MEDELEEKTSQAAGEAKEMRGKLKAYTGGVRSGSCGARG